MTRYKLLPDALQLTNICRSYRIPCSKVYLNLGLTEVQYNNNNNNNNNNDDDNNNNNAIGTISELLRQYLCNIPGKHEIKELQKNSYFGHCTRTMESANVKAQNFSRAK